MSNWKLTVGMEVHVELQTKTKMFCGCKNDPFHSKPNTNVCPVCYGLPGALPVANKKAVEMTIKLGQALKGKIAKNTFWARKNYFYPDLPKGYQISQSTAPLVEEATLTIDGHDHRIERIHLEEDAGKLTHIYEGSLERTDPMRTTMKAYSLVNYNRAGVPLMEIVTHPDFDSGESAKKFCKELQSILRKLDISQADMEKGLMRCEANISVSETDKLGTKVEVKNINSFRAVEKAIKYEYDRQVKALEDGEKITQETRTWDADHNKTVVMRSKETSADYRYFPEPDLPYIETSTIEGEAHKLPDEMRKELVELHVSEHLAGQLVSLGVSDILTEIGRGDNKIYVPQIANLLIKLPLAAELGADKVVEFNLATSKTVFDSKAKLLERIIVGKKEFKDVMDSLHSSQSDLDIASISIKVISENPDLVDRYRSGNEKILNALIGKVMDETEKKADYVQARIELEKQLKS